MSAVSPVPTPELVGGPALVHHRRHAMARYVAWRVGAGLLTLLAVSFLVFLATSVLPGNVATVVLGKNATPESVGLLREKLGLDHSVIHRYLAWLGGLLHGDLGQSAVQVAQNGGKTSVAALIGKPLVNSLILAGITAILLVPTALGLGVWAGMRAGRSADHAVSVSSLIVSAFPEFVVGTFLILIFFAQLNLLPPVALINPGETPFSHPDALVLPIATLLAVCAGSAIRQVRAGVIAVRGQDYVHSAQINGIRSRWILWRYVVRNALAPSVQILAQNIQYLIGGIIVVESVFAYPGIGQFLVGAVSTRDVTEVNAVVIILATIYIAINIVADIIVVLLVPKLRTEM